MSEKSLIQVIYEAARDSSESLIWYPQTWEESQGRPALQKQIQAVATAVELHFSRQPSPGASGELSDVTIAKVYVEQQDNSVIDYKFMNEDWSKFLHRFARAIYALRAAPNTTADSPRIYTKCPACGNDTLTVNDDKHLLCTWVSCPEPTLIDRGIPAEKPAVLSEAAYKELFNSAHEIATRYGTAILRLSAVAKFLLNEIPNRLSPARTYYVTKDQPPAARDADGLEMVEAANFGDAAWKPVTWNLVGKYPSVNQVWRKRVSPPAPPEPSADEMAIREFLEREFGDVAAITMDREKFDLIEKGWKAAREFEASQRNEK